MHPRGFAVTTQGACIFDPLGPRLTRQEQKFFGRVTPFGFILFARNIKSAGQVKALCRELRDAAGHDAPVLIDQEGGRVQRLKAPTWREWPTPLEHVRASGGRAWDVMYLRYRIIAAELRDLGIDSNCAPLVDVATPETHSFLTDRCYGFDARDVADIGRAVSDGLLHGGVLPVLKHMPGHGRATEDSHKGLPVVTAAHDALGAEDFLPFSELADLPMGMTAHVVYTAMDSRPATLSPVVMAAIRDEIGFGGLVMTDDLSMNALEGTLADRAIRARAAGCDVVLHCNGDLAQKEQVADAAGRLTGVGAQRAARALSWRRDPDTVDISQLEEKLDSAMRGLSNGC